MSSRRRASTRAFTGAFTLLETLVAIAILGLAVTSSVALMAQYQVLDLRVSGHLEAQRSWEAQVEALRGGLAISLADGEYDLPVARAASSPVQNLRFTARVTAQGDEGLYLVELGAGYEITGRSYDRQMELFLWRP